MAEVPKKAGKATLEWVNPHESPVREPTRDGDKILLPNYRDIEMFPLQKDWNQFLFAMGTNAESKVKLWFGGTDENPFLVRLNPTAYSHFLDGIGAFYQHLIPSRMEVLVQGWGGNYVRQGDIFAYPLPWRWQTIERAVRVVTGEREGPRPVDQPVFGTRHSLLGLRMVTEVMGMTKCELVSGVIEAPDHEAVTLDYPCILGQTQNLYDPPRAD